MDKDLQDALKNLRVNPSPDSVDVVFSNDCFRSLVSLSTKGNQDGMVVAFLQDVSSLLALLSSVREGAWKDISKQNAI